MSQRPCIPVLATLSPGDSLIPLAWSAEAWWESGRERPPNHPATAHPSCTYPGPSHVQEPKLCLPNPLEGNLLAPKCTRISSTSYSHHGSNPGLAPSSHTWARAVPSGPPAPALVPHCLSSLQQPPQGGCEHLTQIRPSPLPTALHGSHLPLGKKPKSWQWPVPTLPSPPPSLPLSDSAPATQASSSLFL